MTTIHETAIVHPGAVLGAECSVGPYSIIGEHVVLGARNRVGPHVVIDGRTTFGDDNQIFQFASVGSIPQDLKFKGEPSTLSFGSGNIIREFVTIQPGTSGGGMKTVIGDRNLFMANSHIGHDCIVGSGNIFANSAAIAGHVTIGNNITIGGLAAVHQFVRLGDGALIGGGTMVVKDIPPFCIANGDRAHLVGINVVGMERKGVSPEGIQQVRKAYRTLFLAQGSWSERLEQANLECGASAEVELFLGFVRQSERGITTPRSRSVDS